MEQQKLPNATISLVLGIISFIACCVSSGLGGIILSGIALFLANKDRKTYALQPELYDNYSQLKTARIIAIIGLILGIVTLLISVIFIVSLGGLDAYMQRIQEMQTQYQ